MSNVDDIFGEASGRNVVYFVGLSGDGKTLVHSVYDQEYYRRGPLFTNVILVTGTKFQRMQEVMDMMLLDLT